MPKPKLTVAHRDDSADQSIDPIPALYRLYAELQKQVPGSADPDHRERLTADYLYRLEDRILTTPARSFEGAIRQVQMIASDLDAFGADTENADEKHIRNLPARVWLVMFGVLNYALPLVEQIEDDPHYNLALPGGHSALTLFRQMQEVLK